MEQIVAKLLQDFELGKMNRQQLIQSLAVAASAASAAAPLEPPTAKGSKLSPSITSLIRWAITPGPATSIRICWA